MRIDISNRIYARAGYISDDDRLQLAAQQRLKPARWIDVATHAICRHGVICRITESHHSCGWTKLVAA